MLHDQDLNRKCPCGSEKPFSFCCEPAIEGARPAATAEALMRSRYTAFAMGMVDYLINTTAKSHRNPDDAVLIEDQMRATTWTGLTINAVEDGEQNDNEGTVEFTACFEAEGEAAALHEKSNFRREDGNWVYVDGDVEILPQGTS